MQISAQPYPFTGVDAGIEWSLITPTYNATSDVYVFTLAGVTVKTITVNYSDATKEVITTITKA